MGGGRAGGDRNNQTPEEGCMVIQRVVQLGHNNSSNLHHFRAVISSIF